MVTRHMKVESTTNLPPAETVAALATALGSDKVLTVDNLSEVTSIKRGQVIVVRGSSAGTVLSRRNLQRDPMATATGSFGTSLGTLSIVTDFPGAATAVRWTRTSTGSGRISILTPELVASKQYATRFAVRCSVETTFTLAWRPVNTSSSTGQVAPLTGLVLPAGVSIVEATFNTGAQATTTPSLALIPTTGSVNDTVDVTQIGHAEGAAFGTYFDGASSAVDGLTYSWDGAANASTSREVRNIFAATVYAA